MKKFPKTKPALLKLLVLLIGSTLIAILIAVWAKSDSHDFATTSNKYFSIQYPRNLKAKTTKFSDSVTKPKGEVVAVLIAPSATDVLGDSVYAVVEPAKGESTYKSGAELKKSLGGPSETIHGYRAENVTLNGVKAQKATYTQDLVQTDKTLRVTYLRAVKGTRIYVLRIASEKQGSEFDKQVPAIFDSFHLK